MRKELNPQCRTYTRGGRLRLVDKIMFNYFQNILDLTKNITKHQHFFLVFPHRSWSFEVLVQMTPNVNYLSQNLPKAASV